MTPEEIAEQLGNPIGLKERIRRENWIAQAQELAALGKKTEPQALPNTLRSSQGHETFAAELVLEADNQVSQTRLMHVPSGDEERWDGWNERLLINFFINRAGLHFSTAAAPVEPTLESSAEPLPGTGVEAALSEKPPAVPPDDAKPEPSNPENDLSGVNLEILAGDPRVSSRILRHDQPFCVRLLLDWANQADKENQPLTYTATIHTNRVGKVGSGQEQTNYQRRGRLVAGKSAFLRRRHLSSSRRVSYDGFRADPSKRSRPLADLRSGVSNQRGTVAGLLSSHLWRSIATKKCLW